MTEDKNIQNAPRSNVPELSVSELAFSLKKTLEDTYGHVRIRGELSRVKIHTSGHMYSDLKDENACINVVCWKGTVARLSVRPEEGLEVICTGRISTYPARSNYQLIIESMELAGEGALLKMLEERKKKLAAEGLFDAARKKKLPFLPRRIGVVTSPTGAVIRDIMHRLNDRFPRHVLLWPVLVQGPGAAEQIAAAINGFNALDEHLRPDLLIVARGGGSLEDLMAFNEENVVRAAADSLIPLISAVGHETDTTLIDYAADIRAPTPTGAAEIAVPRRIDLLAQIREGEQRLTGAIGRKTSVLGDRLENIAARLGDPQRLLENKIQSIDHLSHKLDVCFERGHAARRERLLAIGGKLEHPRALINEKAGRLENMSHKLFTAFERHLALKRERVNTRAARLREPGGLVAERTRTLGFHAERLKNIETKLLGEKIRDLHTYSRMLESLSFKSVLNRGYVVVRDENNRPLTDAAQTNTGQTVFLEFKNDQKVSAVVGKKPKTAKGAAKAEEQQQLF